MATVDPIGVAVVVGNVPASPTFSFALMVAVLADALLVGVVSIMVGIMTVTSG